MVCPNSEPAASCKGYGSFLITISSSSGEGQAFWAGRIQIVTYYAERRDGRAGPGSPHQSLPLQKPRVLRFTVIMRWIDADPSYPIIFLTSFFF
jgi:hypothetical protein